MYIFKYKFFSTVYAFQNDSQNPNFNFLFRWLASHFLEYSALKNQCNPLTAYSFFFIFLFLVSLKCGPCIHIEPPIPPTLHRFIHPAGILSKKRICFPTKSILNSVHVLTVLYRAEGPLPDHYAVYIIYM